MLRPFYDKKDEAFLCYKAKSLSGEDATKKGDLL